MNSDFANMAKEQRVPLSPPEIAPVPSGTHRPQWSVMIPVFNCASYLPATLGSVLRQDPGDERMQIEVVDDCSTDADVAALVARIGRGRVSYFRQPYNRGSLLNFKTCLDRSRGMLVHLLHGDDLVREGYYKHIGNLFEKFPDAGAAYCRFAYINASGEYMYCHEAEMDSDGILDNWVERLCERQRLQYVAVTVRRSVYEHLGGFYGAEYGEDWEMWTRIAAHYPVAYTPTVLAEYRRHNETISARSFLTGRNMRELAWVMETIGRYLPPHRKPSIQRESRKFYAHYAMRVANTLWSEMRDREGARAQVREAWNMRKDPMLLCKILKLYTRMNLNI